MRIKRSVSRFFGVLVVPALSLAVVGYFGSYAIWGNRGILSLQNTHAELGLKQQQLAELKDSRARLEHRIALMEKNGSDPDLVEELARTELMTAAPNQVAVSRTVR
jgi:cell division protein FtsB